METYFIITEGWLDVAIIQTLLTFPKNTHREFCVSLGMSSIVSTSRTIINLQPNAKLLIVVDSDIFFGGDENRISQYFKIGNNKNVKLIIMNPNIESALNFDKDLPKKKESYLEYCIQNLEILRKNPNISQIQEWINNNA